jgi:hypothetical protein
LVYAYQSDFVTLSEMYLRKNIFVTNENKLSPTSAIYAQNIVVPIATIAGNKKTLISNSVVHCM